MDHAATYRVSQSLTIQINPRGRLVASTSAFSRLPKELGPEAIPVLQAFGGGSTPARAMAGLAEEWEFDEAGFAELVDTLLGEGLLVPEREGGAASTDGFNSLQMQHFMVRDTIRVMAYRAAITAHAPGRSVVEVGCGTGILSLFAAQAGARRVVAIEETSIAGLAREMVRANGFEGVVEVVSANSRDVELDEPAELLIHEILGTDPFSENLMPYILDARERLLVKGGRMIPGRLELYCAGIHAEDPNPGITRSLALREGRELAGLYGLDFSPYLQAIQDEPEFRRTLWVQQREFPHPILSAECRLYDLDFSADLSASGETVEATLEIQSAGDLTSLVLYFRAHLDERICLTTSPFAPKTHWGWTVRDLTQPLAVRAGDRIALRARVETVLGRQQLQVDLA
ncbi:MAG TPA: 50S ribosomal protein L11 methyltransferase [Thermoanaerobaculia bacterium]|nr:50S ribosomal protein L11 methyltransferase [Thermoanaerobaculia bacterium]